MTMILRYDEEEKEEEDDYFVGNDDYDDNPDITIFHNHKELTEKLTHELLVSFLVCQPILSALLANTQNNQNFPILL